MPEADSSKFLQQAYWRLDRLLAWIAYRGAKWSWDNSWPPEIAKAFGLLMTALKKGTARGSRRLGKTGLRHPIEPYEWCDVELLRYGNPRFYGQEEPRFYDKNTPAQQHYAATAEPWIDVLFEVESALKAFPATPEAPPDKAVGTLRTQGRKKKKQPAPRTAMRTSFYFSKNEGSRLTIGMMGCSPPVSISIINSGQDVLRRIFESRSGRQVGPQA